MSGLLGSKIGGLLGDSKLKDAFWLTLASGADPQRAMMLKEDKRRADEESRMEVFRDFQMRQAQAQMEQAQKEQERQSHAQGALQSMAGLDPRYQAMYANDPAFQRSLRTNQAAYGDPAMLEQAGLLAPLPQGAKQTTLQSNLLAMGIDPMSEQGRSIMMQSMIKPQTSVNVNTGGPSLPKDMTWADPSNPAAGVAVIPGSETDIKRRAEAAKAEAAAATASSGAATTIGKIDTVMGEVNRALGSVGWTTAGLLGAATKDIPATPAKNLAGALTTIKANIGFDALQQMRAASPTGGALGQVAVQELESLQASIASLDQSQGPEQLAANLQKVRNHYARWRATVEQAKSGTVVPNSSPAQQPQAPQGSVNWSDL